MQSVHARASFVIKENGVPEVNIIIRLENLLLRNLLNFLGGPHVKLQIDSHVLQKGEKTVVLLPTKRKTVIFCLFANDIIHEVADTLILGCNNIV